MTSLSCPSIIVTYIFVITVLSQEAAGFFNSPGLLSQLSTKDEGVVLPLTRKQIAKMSSWCKSQQYEQVVKHEGCQSIKIVNRLCYGQCNSFYIPRYKDEFEACSKCTPTDSALTPVKLNCEGNTSKIKKVFIVKRCGCRPCNYHNFNDFS